MACKKYEIINTGSTNTYLTFRRCDDGQYEWNKELVPFRIYHIWTMDDIFDSAEIEQITFYDEGQFPPTTTTTTVLQTLSLTFDDITNADMLVGDSTNVDDWNTFFDLPNFGNSFSSVQVSGNTVNLVGGSNIKVKGGLMYDYNYNTFLLKIIDTGCITSVGGDAFSYCYGLTDVSLPKCTTVYGYQDSPYNDYGGFGECVNLTNVNIPLLEQVGDTAFSNLYSSPITEFNFPLLMSAGTYSFGNIPQLTNINFPSLLNVGTQCFYNCNSLTGVTLVSATTIGESCFNYCTSLTSVDLPSSIIISFYCFYNCVSLTTVYLPQLTTAGDGCFGNCPSLTSVDLPSLTTAGDGCFGNCTSLTSVDLPSLTTAGDGCFGNCTSLTSVDLPSLTTAGSGFFADCTSLTTVDLPVCTALGPSILFDGVFNLITGNNINLTIPSALMTCNSGNPDGDIQYLQANNTVNIITV